jgi:hypothetical protein
MGVFSRVRRVARLVLTLGVMGVSAASVFGQVPQTTPKTTVLELAVPLLPAKFGPWLTEGESAPCSDCLHPEGATAAVFKEDGLSRAGSQTYHLTGHQTGKTDTIKVEAYQFVDATGAYSAFTYLRRPEMKGLLAGRKIGTQSASTGGGEFLVLSGTTVVKAVVSSVRPTTSDELRQLASTLPKVGGPKGLSPLLPTYLPQKGLQAESVRYALGPLGYQAMGGVLPPEIISFDKAGEVVTAKYADKGTLTLLLFPTPQIAGDNGRAVEAEMNRQGAAAGTVKLRREGPLVLLTTGRWSPAEAKSMVEGIHLRNELTWNKQMPQEFHAEVVKTYSLLTSIAVFCGVGALGAIILGLFLGGGRAAIRMLQGKPAASEPEFLRIDLSGRVAPLHPEGPGAESPR